MSEPSSRAMEQADTLFSTHIWDGTSRARREWKQWVALALDAARVEAWAEGFEAAKAVVIAMNSEERTTSPNDGGAEG